ncbi:hypothetical protein ACMYSQ_007130, partial [Aspergillus niger]
MVQKHVCCRDQGKTDVRGWLPSPLQARFLGLAHLMHAKSLYCNIGINQQLEITQANKTPAKENRPVVLERQQNIVSSTEVIRISAQHFTFGDNKLTSIPTHINYTT